MFGGIYFWFEKITGVPYNEVLGQIHFWVFFVGVNLTFFPMHFLGVAGMPRRVPDYPDAFYAYNKIASWGSYVSAYSTLIFFYMVYSAFRTSATDQRTSRFLRMCANQYILLNYKIVGKGQLPTIIILLSVILGLMVRDISELLLVFCFYMVFFNSLLIFFLPCKRFKPLGKRVAAFLQRHATPIVFETLYGKKIQGQQWPRRR
jgi:hypothetical protein